jgi:outer membrane protein, multidrug efflux system
MSHLCEGRLSLWGRTLPLAYATGAVVLVLAGCTVGPDYRPPQVPMEAAYVPAETARGEQRWWAALCDQALAELLSKAASDNLDLALAQARIREARAQRAIVGGAQWPTVNTSADYMRTQLSQNAAPYNAFSIPGFPWEFNTYQAGFDANWELDIFGGTRRAVEAATDSVQAAQEQRQAVRVSMLGEVARTYIELRSNQRQHALAQENLDLQNQTLALVRDRAKNGVGSELDVSRATAQAAATEAELPVYERGEWQALFRLAVLTNQPLDHLLALRAPKAIPTPPDAVLVGVPAELLRRRPDIRRAERQLAAATAAIGVAEAQLYPKLSLTGFFNLQSASIEDLFEWSSRSYGIGPTIAWPIFEGGRLRAAVAVRNAQQEAALVAYEQTVLGAVQEVRDQLIAFSTERQRHLSLTRAVASSQDAVDLARKLYAQGLTDFLTVLEAQRALYVAEIAQARSDTLLDADLIALYKALGGAWDTDSAEESPPQGSPAAPATIPGTLPAPTTEAKP